VETSKQHVLRIRSAHSILVSTDFAAGLFPHQLVVADWPQPQARLETIQLEQQRHLRVPRPRLMFKLVVLGRWLANLEHSPLSRWELQCSYEKLSVGVLGPVWLQLEARASSGCAGLRFLAFCCWTFYSWILVLGRFLGVLILVPGPRYRRFVPGILVLGVASTGSLGSLGSLRRSQQSLATTGLSTVLPLL